jgi:hypothetical protein
MTQGDATPAPEYKEVQMDVPDAGGVQAGGGTRRRRRARRAKTQKGGADTGGQIGVTVEKTPPTSVIAAAPVPAPAPAPAPVPAPAAAQQSQGGGAKPSVAKQLATTPAPVVVLAPAKKKAKIMLVSKKEIASGVVAAPAKLVPQKTFKAKRVRVTIDNTARTQKRRRQVLRSVDSLTEEQLKEQAVKFGLSREDSVKKVPLDLLRKMLKDYYAMRKGFL